MPKNCLTKLPGNILVDCEVPVHGISNLYLMHAGDVTFTYAYGGSQISAVTFAPDARSYKVEGYKQNLQATVSLRSTDASVKFDVSVMFKSKLMGTRAQVLMTGRFYVMLEEPVTAGSNTVWGCTSPLECSNVDYDSNANGKLVTYTLSAPEGSAGNSHVVTSAAAATSIIAKSV